MLVAVGLPLLAGGRGGLGVFATPSVGFLVGWPVAAFVVGWLTERGGSTYRLPWGIVANLLGGVVVLYALGIAGIALVAGISVQAAAVSTWIFLPGDLVKVGGRGPRRARRARGLPGPARRRPAAGTRSARLSEVADFLAAHAAGEPVCLGTSGTSGAARSVVRTTDSWVSSFDAVSRLTGLTADSRVWVPGPLAATMNLFAAVHATVLGATARRRPRGRDARPPHPRRPGPASPDRRCPA